MLFRSCKLAAFRDLKVEDDGTLECPEICTHVKWYLSCNVGSGLINNIWRLVSDDGLKDAIRKSVDRIRDSFARARIPVVEKD